MRQTPLIRAHRAAGAKLVDFAGWEMPIQYSGVVDEYQSVRTRAGLFDVSHMGRIGVAGSGAVPFLQRLATNDVSTLAVGQSQYSMICNDRGGIKDDIFIYAVAPQEFLVCVNASNRDKILTWLKSHLALADGCRVTDRSEELVQLALQGPASRDLLSAMNINGLSELKPRQCLETKAFGGAALVARTGYTGELGYELYVPAEQAETLWGRLLETGGPLGLKPAGLGARDLLRLEMGYLLYGNDIDEETTPMEAGAQWVVKFEKGDFLGRDALLQRQQAGLSRQLVAFELLERAVPRQGHAIHGPQNQEGSVGSVTSGNFSPLLQKGIGLGYVPPAFSSPGSRLQIDIRGKFYPAAVVPAPFYKKPKAHG